MYPIIKTFRKCLEKLGVPQKTVYKHSAGGVVLHNGQVLLIHWDPPRDSYDFPKGAIDKNESPEDACLREVYEETGYRTQIVRFIGTTHYEYAWKDGTHHHKTVEYFLLALDPDDQQNPTPKRERHETFVNAWVPIVDAEATITRDIDKEILRKTNI